MNADFSGLEIDAVAHEKFEDVACFSHVFRGEAQAVRIGASEHSAEISSGFDRPDALERNIDCYGHRYAVRLSRAKPPDGGLRFFADEFLRSFGRPGFSGMKSERPLGFDGFYVPDRGANFSHSGVIAGDKDNRNAELSRDRGIPGAFGDRDAVEGDTSKARTRKCVGADTFDVVRRGVVTDKHCGVEIGIEAAHHAQGLWGAAHDPDIGGELLNEKILFIAVGIGDDDFGRTTLFRSLNGGQRLLGHKTAEAIVLKRTGQQLISRNNPGDAFHVDGDEDS